MSAIEDYNITNDTLNSIKSSIDRQITFTRAISRRVGTIDTSIGLIEKRLNTYSNFGNSSSSGSSNSIVLDTIKGVFEDNFKDYIETNLKGLLQHSNNVLESGVSNAVSSTTIGGILTKVYPWVAIAKLGTEIATKIGGKIIEVGDRVWSEKLQPGMQLDEIEAYIKHSAGETKGAEIVESINNAIYNSPIDPTQAFKMGDVLASTISKTGNVGENTSKAFNIAERLAYSNKTKDMVGISEAINSALNGNFSELVELYNIDKNKLDVNELSKSNVSVSDRLEAINSALNSMGLDSEYLNQFRNVSTNKYKMMQNKEQYGLIQMTDEKRKAIDDNLNSWIEIFDSSRFKSYTTDMVAKDIEKYNLSEGLKRGLLTTRMSLNDPLELTKRVNPEYYEKMDPYGLTDVSNDLSPSDFIYEYKEKDTGVVQHITVKDTVINENVDVAKFMDDFAWQLAKEAKNSSYR